LTLKELFMADRILVSGATGLQGGAVARHLLKRGKSEVCCLTRRPDSEAAKTFKQLGADVVKADFDDPSSVKLALRGCTAVFGVTNFWEAFQREYEQGINLIDAASDAEVAHLVLSTLPSAAKISNGAIAVSHFETKARMEEHARLRGVRFTFVHVAFYFENFINYFSPRKQADGTYGFGFPMAEAPLAALAVDDTGGVVTAIFENPGEFLGATIEIVGDQMSARQFAETMSRVLRRKVTYNHIPRDEYATLGFPGARDLADMFEFLRVYVPSRRAEIAQCRRLYPSMQTFEAWLQANVEGFAAG
jgi:uncharacterized protein YbjT (DUF2867 family)